LIVFGFPRFKNNPTFALQNFGFGGLLTCGVMVTQQILILLFQVRVLAGQQKKNPLSTRAGF
jgi:hypothetical protein